MLKLIDVGFIILILCSLFGFIILNSIVHEYIHKFDLKKYSVEGEGEICLLNAPKSIRDVFFGPTAYYEFSANESMSEEIKKEVFWSEIKAYSANILMAIIYFVCYYFILKRWWIVRSVVTMK